MHRVLRRFLSAAQLAAALLLLAFILKVAGIELPFELTRGATRVIDGDSLKVGGREIRLGGIDAPELRQTCLDGNRRSWDCGRQARALLEGLVRRGKVLCRTTETDKYGRLVSHCKAGETALNEEMLRQGFAVAYIHHTLQQAYLETQARLARRGIWRGSFERPEDWRRRERLVTGGMVPD